MSFLKDLFDTIGLTNFQGEEDAAERRRQLSAEREDLSRRRQKHEDDIAQLHSRNLPEYEYGNPYDKTENSFDPLLSNPYTTKLGETKYVK